MNLFLIEKYIQRIKKEDIYNYALSQGITLDNNELETLYYYLKNYYKPFLKGNQIELLQELKSKVKPTTASKIEELYLLYKDKI